MALLVAGTAFAADRLTAPEMDALFAALADPARRMAILKDVQEKIVREAYWIPMFEPLNVAAIGPKVKGAVLQSNADMNMSQIWLES